MFEGAFPSPDTNPTEAITAEPPVIWLEHGEGVAPGADVPVARERDPEAVIEFLLKKVDEQQGKIADQDAYTELLNQEVEQLRGQLQVTREELDRQLSDYEVMMQNALATERELESFKQRVSEKPKISLPFHTEQKLAKLGWTDSDPAMEAKAV